VRIKICGITQLDQGQAIARLGATALGFICVPSSPRYVPPDLLQELTTALQATYPHVDRIGVFADASLEDIAQVAAIAPLTGIQLHGSETPAFCAQLQHILPTYERIKALRIRDEASLADIAHYRGQVNTLLLDAYHPTQLGGTGQTFDWRILQSCQLDSPWFLSGGLRPDNILTALELLQPQGIDLSSGVEQSPGHKDLTKVAQLFEQLKPVAHGAQC
jgi:phosphoribosylanthranilate isomerase